jgi:hypothetical protein
MQIQYLVKHAYEIKRILQMIDNCTRGPISFPLNEDVRCTIINSPTHIFKYLTCISNLNTTLGCNSNSHNINFLNLFVNFQIIKTPVNALSHEQMVELLKTSMTVTVTVIPPHPDGSPRRGCNLQVRFVCLIKNLLMWAVAWKSRLMCLSFILETRVQISA